MTFNFLHDLNYDIVAVATFPLYAIGLRLFATKADNSAHVQVEEKQLTVLLTIDKIMENNKCGYSRGQVSLCPICSDASVQTCKSICLICFDIWLALH